MTTTLLHIAASPMGAASTSRKVATALLESYAAAHPRDEIATLDLWRVDLPELDSTFVAAQNKVLSGAEQTPAEREVWDRVVSAAEALKSADKVLLSCPMWNFNIPYRLKHWFDVILQPGLTFAWTPEEGYRGLVTGRPAQLVLSRAGQYTPPAPAAWMDHQTGYLEFLFRFMGFTDIHTLAVEPTLLQGPERAARGVHNATAAAREAGRAL